MHGQLPIFVNRAVSLTGLDSIQSGMQMASDETFIYPRDYLVPAHNDSWDGFYPKLVEPPALANLMRMVLGKLGTPRFQDDSWRTNMAMLLVPGDLLLFWTGHSPRHFLNQAALSLGVPKERRDYLGRWSIGRTGSNAYIHTARQVVETIQMDVVNALLQGTGTIDESELLDEVAQFAEEHGLVGHRIRRRHTQQLDRGVPSLEPEGEVSDVENVDLETQFECEVPKVSEQNVSTAQPKFFL